MKNKKQKVVRMNKLAAHFLKLKAQIEALEAKKLAVAEKLIPVMEQLELTKTPGVDGIELIIREELTCKYDKKAEKYARRQGLVRLFTPKMSITRSKVLKAKDKNKITLTQFTRLEKLALDVELKKTLVAHKIKEEKEGG